MQAGNALGLGTCPTYAPSNLTDMLALKIRVGGCNRSIQQPDHNFRLTAGAFHQHCKLDQIQVVHDLSPFQIMVQRRECQILYRRHVWDFWDNTNETLKLKVVYHINLLYFYNFFKII